MGACGPRVQVYPFSARNGFSVILGRPMTITELLGILREYGDLLLAASLASLVVAVLSFPLIVARIPPDYFSHPHRHRLSARARHPLVLLLLATIKNLLGALFLLAGLVMLFTPGQGLLTMLVGLMLMNYPGKYRLERWLVTRPKVLQALNWMRARTGYPPLAAPRDLPGGVEARHGR